MKAALIGAGGYVGSFLLKEALNRGHKVTAILRHPEKISIKHENLTIRKGDVRDPAEVAKLAAGHDAVISAYNPGWENPDIHNEQVAGYDAIISGVKKAGVRRLLIVGGAGSLETASGHQLVDSPEFPGEFKGGALAMRDVLNKIRAEKILEWSFLCPSMNLEPGERTGNFRVGGDRLLIAEDGESRISCEDFAMAMIDELEVPKNVRRRFTVGY